MAETGSGLQSPAEEGADGWPRAASSRARGSFGPRGSVSVVRLAHVVVSHCFKLISLPTFKTQVALHRNRGSWLLLQRGSSGSMEPTLRT